MNDTTIPVLITGGMALLGRASRNIAPTNSRGGGYGKIILGTFIAGAMLSVLTGEGEHVATVLAWVAALTSILVNGQTTFNALSRITG